MNAKKISLFLILTCLLSWSLAGAIFLLKLELQSTWAMVLMIAYMYMPALSALIVQKFMYGEDMIKPLKISFTINKFFFWAIGIPAIISIIVTFFGFIFPGYSFDPEMNGFIKMMSDKVPQEKIDEMMRLTSSLPFHIFWLQLVQGFIAAATINALAAFGEELGWRGFLLNEFGSKTYFSASLSIGVIWGLWHAPLILMGHNYPVHPGWGVLFMTLFCTLYSFLINYFTLRAKSVIAAAIMHGAINAFAGIPIMLSSASHDLIIGNTGLSGLIVLFLAVILLFIYDFYLGKERLMMKSIQEIMKA